MSNTSLDITLGVRSEKLRSGLQQGRSAITRFASSVRDDFRSIGSAMNSIGGRLAGLGLGFSAVASVIASAKLDRSLTAIGQTAGASQAKVTLLRSELFKMARQTGQEVESLQAGFNNLIQSGQTWDQALTTIDSVNIAMGVTKASAETLTSGLTVASAAFNFDLSKPGLALQLLDKMTVAGRAGNAELEDLSGIFSRVGVNAKAAGMSFDKTLAFIEALSLLEKSPERLATLADSTTRIFTNQRYSKMAERATGVKFFDKNGARREVDDVLLELRSKFKTFSSEQEKAGFIQKAFGTVDLDTQKGLRTLLQGDTLEKMAGIQKAITESTGTLKKDLPNAISNAADQASRLKTTLRAAADSFIKPMNAWASKGIKKLLDPKDAGGFGLSGGQLIAGAALSTVAAIVLGRRAKGLAGRLFSGGSSVASGVAQGKALEAAAGVTPVFVTNMPEGGKFSPVALGQTATLGVNVPVILGLLAKAGAIGLVSAIGVVAFMQAKRAADAVGKDGLRKDSEARQLLNKAAEENDPLIQKFKGKGPDLMNKFIYNPATGKTEVNINVAVDKSGRVTAENKDGKAKVNLNRGNMNPVPSWMPN